VQQSQATMEEFDSLFVDFVSPDELHFDAPQFSIQEPSPIHTPQQYYQHQYVQRPAASPNVFVCQDPRQLQQLQSMGVPFILVNLQQPQAAITPVTPSEEFEKLSMRTSSPMLQPQINTQVTRRSDIQLQAPPPAINITRRHSCVTPEIVQDSSSDSEMPLDMLEQIKNLPAYDAPLSYFADSPTDENGNPVKGRRSNFGLSPAVDKIKKKPNRLCRSANSTPITPMSPTDNGAPPRYLVSVQRKSRKKKQLPPESSYMMKFSLRE
jgi:hypothetical protein